MPLVSCPGGFTVFPMSLLAVFLLSFHIRAARADYSLVVLLQSSPAWDTLTPRHKICSTGAGSPARRFSNCASKDCFCDKPKEIDEKLMECVTSWSLAIEDPLDAYNGAMSFYASECGTFVFQRKEYLTREVIYQNAAPTPAPSPAGGGIGGEATTTRYSPRSTTPSNSTTGGSGGGGGGGGFRLGLGGILGISGGGFLGILIGIILCCCCAGA